MAHVPDPAPSVEPDDGLPKINYYPNDVAIVSIRDARRRLTFADGLRDDLRQLAQELQRLKREALEAAGQFDVEVTYDPALVRSLLANVPAPADWGNEWMIDLIYPGEIYHSALQCQSLRRVAAYAGIPSAEVREVIDRVGTAMDAALEGRGPELLPRLQDVVEQLYSAAAEYEHLRDSIAGRLDRMQAEQEPNAQEEEQEDQGKKPTRNIKEENAKRSTRQPVKSTVVRRPAPPGRPRLESSSDPRSRAQFNLYEIIRTRRQEAASRTDLARLLDAERDIRDLAKEAGFPDGVTAEVVRKAEQFARDRQKTQRTENPPH